MITHCEECDTYFRVSIDQLKAANGQVKCGCCMTVFNAIESLLENNDALSQQNIAPEEEENKSIGSSILGGEPVDEPIETYDEEFNIDSSYEDEDDDLSELEDEEYLDDEEVVVDKENEVEDNITIESERLNFTEEELAIFDDFADEDDTLNIEQTQSNKIWKLTSIFFIGLILFQLFSFNSNKLIAKFPQLKPICVVIDCPVVEVKTDTSTINLISRDVREHPQFRDVLLVNATLMNSAQNTRAFPTLQLDLFNKVGRPVGSRQFLPAEYLDQSVNIKTGMKPRQPVHIVLEILGSAEETNSFEFKFL